MTSAGITIDTNGLSLSGSSTASVRAGGQSFPDVNVDYNGFEIGFGPTQVTAGEATLSYQDKAALCRSPAIRTHSLNIPAPLRVA
ncbi:MAG: hypothetical protein U5K71_08970 [Gracilimonas sp.]|nr:hypothetical protein [Gracilimonas sp.]